MNTRIFASLTVPTLLLAAGLAAAEKTNVVAFSDPTKPGKLEIQAGRADVTVTGSDASEVTVRYDLGEKNEPPPRADGLRRLDSDEAYSVSEHNNHVTVVLDAGDVTRKSDGKPNGASLNIEIPRNTRVLIHRMGPGSTSALDISGDVEIHGARGSVSLQNLSGGVVAETFQGNVDASLAGLGTGRPVSITTMQGDVDLTVPLAAKANVNLRTQLGEILTDFSKDRLESTFENKGPLLGVHTSMNVNVEVDASMARALAQVDRVRAEQMRQQAEQARQQVEAAREQVEVQRAQAERAREQYVAKALKETEAGTRSTGITPPTPVAPVPPVPAPAPLPPMSGGKMVYGTLNGGGTELQVATISGTITLRKAAP